MRLFCEKCKKDFAVNRDDSGRDVPCPTCGEKIAIPESNTSPGVVIGDFLIEKEIARGGMGVVYLARQISLDRHVALKVLQNRHTGDREYVESLYREARAAARINHPNVVQAYTIGEEDGVFYFAMEYVRGETFKTILKANGGKLEFEQAARVIRDIARALSAAWNEQKLVHQDIKPDNIMLDANGFAKLADLGLAKSGAAHQEENEIADEVLGTPQYISPEQLTGVPTDIRSDIYSLGATFYQFVTGRYAYVADSLDKLPQMHVDGNLEPPKNVNPELPDELNSIIVKMMARLPENRYQDADELIADLEKYLLASKRVAVKEPAAVPDVPQVSLGTTVSRKNPATAASGKTVQLSKPPLTLRMNGTKSVPPATVSGKSAPPASPVPPRPVPPATVSGKSVSPALPVPPRPVPPATVSGKSVPPAPPASLQTASSENEAIPGVKAVLPVAPGVVRPAGSGADGSADDRNAVDTVDEPGKTKKVDTGKIGMIIGKSTKWFFIGLGVLLILLIAFVITVVVLEKKDRLPKFLVPVSEYMNTGVAKAKSRVIELSKPQEVVLNEPSGPVTRQEYLEEVDKLVKFRRANPDKYKEFFAQVDEVYPMLIGPETEEEQQAFKSFLQIFASADEQFRCVAAREQLRMQFQRELAERIERREAIEAERKRKEELKAQRAAEAARRMAELAERNQQAKAEQVKRIKEFKAKSISLSEKLADAMVESVIRGERTVLDDAKREVNDFIALSIPRSDEERSCVDQLKKFSAVLEKEFKNLQAYRKQLDAVNGNDYITVTLNRQVVVLEKIEPGRLRCSSGKRERITALHKLPEVMRGRFYRRLKAKYPKLNNPDFFISLFDRHVDKIALNDKPQKGFWKDYWTYFARSFEKK